MVKSSMDDCSGFKHISRWTDISEFSNLKSSYDSVDTSPDDKS